MLKEKETFGVKFKLKDENVWKENDWVVDWGLFY